jgi:hypothetical protein
LAFILIEKNFILKSAECQLKINCCIDLFFIWPAKSTEPRGSCPQKTSLKKLPLAKDKPLDMNNRELPMAA